jgi:hypothetical protein
MAILTRNLMINHWILGFAIFGPTHLGKQPPNNNYRSNASRFLNKMGRGSKSFIITFSGIKILIYIYVYIYMCICVYIYICIYIIPSYFRVPSGYHPWLLTPEITESFLEGNSIDTLWLFNIAMENCPFIDDFPIKTSIYKGFSMAMLVITRWYTIIIPFIFLCYPID